MEEYGRVILDTFWDVFVALFLAMLGGLARMLDKKDKAPLRFVTIVSNLFVSAFSGLMAMHLVKALGYSGDWICLASGVAGWAGPVGLNLLVDIVARRAGASCNREDEE